MSVLSRSPKIEMERSRKGREESETVQVNLSTNTIIDVAEEKVGDGASVAAEDGLFHISDEEAGIAGAYVGAHGYSFGLEEVGGLEGEVVKSEDQFSQSKEGVSGRVLVGLVGEEEAEGLEAFVMADGSV
ncbi:hypothetical protein chiPu_0000047 [Chiloscyllium punctatum]|uniref:Uncharacterized protein n=1 Tax=Chiloscyllium punctatum TaxID=137246 RepID=A0A401RN56_CHIPU|nr:hypothetical protein [Chiloscyllium punctatum]